MSCIISYCPNSNLGPPFLICSSLSDFDTGQITHQIMSSHHTSFCMYCSCKATIPAWKADFANTFAPWIANCLALGPNRSVSAFHAFQRAPLAIIAILSKLPRRLPPMIIPHRCIYFPVSTMLPTNPVKCSLTPTAKVQEVHPSLTVHLDSVATSCQKHPYLILPDMPSDPQVVDLNLTFGLKPANLHLTVHSPQNRSRYI